VAEQLGVDQTLVSFWETGRRVPNADKRAALADVLGVPVTKLFGQPDEDLPPSGELLQPIAVAVRLGRSLSWIYRQMNTGALAYVTAPDGSRRIPLEAFEAYKAEVEARPSLEEVAAAAARHMLDNAIAEGVLPPEPSAETLARVARAIRTLDVSA
jgi:transcriptional regulator with XRE-family HTH domain